jgi:hypothetical protein
VLRRRKLRFAAVAVGSVVTVLGLASIPSASADGCTVTITVAGGQQFTFQNVPPGTPPTSLPLPVSLPITNVAQSCPSTTTTTPAVTVTTTQPPATTSTSTSTSTSTTPKPKPSHNSSTTSATSTTPTTTTQSSTTTNRSGKGKGLASGLLGLGSAGSNLKQPSAPKKKAKPHKKSTPTPPPAVTPSGVPTPSNPTYSYATPGPAPIGVPNFFIDSFQIPPFLLPIYQAAGSQYDVPWQILAAINEIETDYGRNLSVSSAGAVGWMQFLPSTWKEWGVDANGDGIADPYNPADAIFTAARYLHAAGASKSIQGAIFAYNHAGWYVQSVMLRAELIGGMPKSFISALTGLVQGDFPVAAPAKYADDAVLKKATSRVKGSNAAVTVQSDPNVNGTDIYANAGSPVIAVNDGKIVKIGQNQQLGRYVVLQDATGNTYTYANLGSIPKSYPVPRPVHESASLLAKALLAPAAKASTGPATPALSGPATAGSQQAPSVPSVAKATKEAKKSSAPSLAVTPATTTPAASATTTPAASATTAPAASPTISAPMVKERLFAYPNRPNSYAAGGKLQITPSGAGGNQISDFQEYFSDVLHLAKNQYTLEPLKVGSVVVAGTILGRLGQGTSTDASHLQFMIQPAGKDSPYIDPKPILDGWKLLEATAVYRAAGVNPFVGPHAKNPTVGQILLMSKLQLQTRVLEDPNVKIYACGARDIQDGAIDRRILAVIEFLSASGLKPTVSGLKCGATPNGSNGIDAAGATGLSVDISAINGIPIQGHQGPGSITDITVRRLLTLQGANQPNQIISLMSYANQPAAIHMANHANRIQISYATAYGSNKQLSAEVSNILQPNQWTQLINHLSQISEPIVPVAPSQYAIKTGSQ